MSFVACNICNKVVWAYDHVDDDVCGLANLMGLPCPNCGTKANFDGLSKRASWYEMKVMAKEHGWDWDLRFTSDNHWFTSPQTLSFHYVLYEHRHGVDVLPFRLAKGAKLPEVSNELLAELGVDEPELGMRADEFATQYSFYPISEWPILGQEKELPDEG